MKKLLLIISILVSTQVMNGQTDTIRKKLDYHVTLGTSFSFSPGYGSAFNTYVSPSLVYRATKRFSLNAGVTLMNTTLYNYSPYSVLETGYPGTGNFTSALVYISGQYQLTPNLLLNGTVFKEFPLTTASPQNPYANTKFQGGSLDLTYKAGEHVIIQAGFSIINTNRPLYCDPFYSPWPSAPGQMHW